VSIGSASDPDLQNLLKAVKPVLQRHADQCARSAKGRSGVARAADEAAVSALTCETRYPLPPGKPAVGYHGNRVLEPRDRKTSPTEPQGSACLLRRVTATIPGGQACDSFV